MADPSGVGTIINNTAVGSVNHLKATYPSALNGNIPTGATHGRSPYGNVIYILAAFVIIMFVIFALGSPGKDGQPPPIANVAPMTMYCLLLFGALFILVGWQEFSLLQLVENTPSAKVGSAAEGLNEITGKFTPEEGDYIISPLGKVPCIYYQEELMKLVHTKNGAYWAPVAVYGYGVPSYLSDDTGYLAVDLADANIDFTMREVQQVMDGKGTPVTSGSQKRAQMLQYLEMCKGPCDFSSLDVKFTPYVSQYGYGFGTDPVAIRESVIAGNQNYFSMGRVKTATSMKESKPIKLMLYDPQTKILSVRFESKDKIVKSDKTFAFVSLGLGALSLLTGLWLLSNPSIAF